MAVFDVSQSVIASAAGIVTGATNITPDMLADLEMTLETMELGPLLGLFLQSFLIKFTMLALNIFIFVIVYGRMIEIYLLTSLAPIPVATLSNRELGTMGQNYLRSLFAVGFQGMLILVCVAIYAVLIQGIATSGDPIGAIWGCIGYTVLLCFMLMKPGRSPKASSAPIEKGKVILSLIPPLLVMVARGRSRRACTSLTALRACVPCRSIAWICF